MLIGMQIKIEKHTSGGRCLTYTLTEGRLESRTSYSVEITMTSEKGIESSLADDVSGDLIASEGLLRLLADMEVEPCHLYDVLEDMLPI
jgi:hypothetical protein